MTYPPVLEVVKFIQPLSQCTIEDLIHNSAIVYARAKLHFGQPRLEAHWSEFAWWKAIWDKERGPPTKQRAWKIYTGSDFHSDYGDAEIKFFIRLPPEPTGSWHKP